MPYLCPSGNCKLKVFYMETADREHEQQQVSQLSKQIEVAHERSKEALFTLEINRTETVKDDKLTMLYYLRLGLNKKQAATTEGNPFLNPSRQLLIKDFGDSHRLLFNKFNIYNNHLLVVTRQFESQKEKITSGDMLYSTLVCLAIKGIIFFNGGDISGASQPHKHMQILPNSARQLPIFNEIHHFVQSLPVQALNKVLKFQKFKFLHGIIAISPSDSFQAVGKSLYQAYLTLYQELIIKNKGKYESISDYNIVACDQFILMAVRRKENAFDKVSVNSLGFMGSLLFKDEKVMEDFMNNHTPSSILEDICLQ